MQRKALANPLSQSLIESKRENNYRGVQAIKRCDRISWENTYFSKVFSKKIRFAGRNSK